MNCYSVGESGFRVQFASTAGYALKVQAYAIRRRHWKRRARSKAVREKALLGDLEHAVRSGDDPAVHRIQYELQSMKSWGPQRFSSTLHAVKQKQSQEAGSDSKASIQVHRHAFPRPLKLGRSVEPKP